MKLAAAFALFSDLRAAVRVAFWPTLKDICHNPALISHISRTFMAHVWSNFAASTDERGRSVKQALLLPNASGTVLDIGAGFGHTIQYLDCSKVTRYVALEPNVQMYPSIRQAAGCAGFRESDGTLVILSCRAEDTLKILEALGGPVETIISILTFCSIPSLEHVVTSLIRDVLKPGGQMLFYEHVLSPRADVAWWQRFWTPLWSIFFDGCRLDCPSHLQIGKLKYTDDKGKEVSMWDEGKTWGKPGEPEENLWWHQAGQFKKRVE